MILMFLNFDKIHKMENKQFDKVNFYKWHKLILKNKLTINVKKDYTIEDVNLTKPIIKGNTYDNPWSTWKFASFFDLMRWKLTEKDNKNIPSDPEVRKKLRRHLV